jgi:hypothetical protein
MKNVVFWDIKLQFVPHRRHYVCAAVPSQLMLCKIEVFTAVTMKNVVFWCVAPCGSLRTYVSEECDTSSFTVERIKELGTLAGTSNSHPRRQHSS